MSFTPIQPSDLGLTRDQDLNYVPSAGELQAAAVRALDDLSALFILNRENEQAIADQLENIVSILLAASQVKGPHQAKAIRLGLHLRHRFWQNHGKEDAWLQLIMPLLKTALEIQDAELIAQVYNAWGLYLFTSRRKENQPKSAHALEVALGYANDSGRDDLKLLARVEHFNQQIDSLSEEDALTEAQAILTGARHSKYLYVEGRVYVSLARFYGRLADFPQIFHYAQLGVIVFWTVNDYALCCESISLLLGSLQPQTPRFAYRQQLLHMLEKISANVAYPFISGNLYHQWAVQYYQLERYEEAREPMIRAWLIFRKLRDRPSLIAAEHMMGLIEMRCHRWNLAELFLKAACRGYQELEVEPIQIVHIRHAIAFIPFEKGDYAAAYHELKEVLEIAQALPSSPSRDWIIDVIEKDVARALAKKEDH